MSQSDRLQTWQALLTAEHAPLRDAAAQCDPQDVAAVTRLRRDHPAELVAAALDLAQARRKAQAKFPDIADRLVADPVGVEQASSTHVANHKARRLAAAAGTSPVLDLCCGIGGDAMAMQHAGLTVRAVDLDPVRAWMCQQNAGCSTRVADVTQLTDRDTYFHLDPARRAEGRRIFRLADYQPGPVWLADWLTRNPSGVIKLSPGIDLQELAESDLAGEVEFISEAGRLTQGLLWTGDLQGHARRATLLSADGKPHTLAGEPGIADLAPASRYLFTVDSSVERAGLLHKIGLPMLHPQLGLFTSDELVGSPWLTAFELLEEMPFQRKRVKRWLGDRGGGIVEIKTRGGAVNPDTLQQELRGAGDNTFTLFVLRWDQKLVTLITRRVT